MSDDVQREIEEAAAKAARLTALRARFPDLKRHADRWDHVRYCAPSANVDATRYEARHSCGCCPDSLFLVWPYMETPHGRVYSDPPSFSVGARDEWSGCDLPFDGWRAAMSKANIPPVVMDEIDHYFREQQREHEAYRHEDDEELEQP